MAADASLPCPRCCCICCCGSSSCRAHATPAHCCAPAGQPALRPPGPPAAEQPARGRGLRLVQQQQMLLPPLAQLHPAAPQQRPGPHSLPSTSARMAVPQSTEPVPTVLPAYVASCPAAAPGEPGSCSTVTPLRLQQPNRHSRHSQGRRGRQQLLHMLPYRQPTPTHPPQRLLPPEGKAAAALNETHRPRCC